MAQHQLPARPCPEGTLATYFPAETLRYHSGKPHAGHVDMLNTQVGNTEFESAMLQEIIRQTASDISNSAAAPTRRKMVRSAT